MVYRFDPRTNSENINSKSAPRRLLEDILTNKIVDSMSNGTASNYFSSSYGSNHRILYEGVARLLSEVLVDTLDNLEDIEFSQLRAEFVSTRLMYLVFPDEASVPIGDNHEETILFLLQTYKALLEGTTKKAIDEVLNDISEGNAIVISAVNGYITNLKSSILATTEFNDDGVFSKHKHFAFTDESGLGSTNKPIEYRWGDKLHTHDIINGVIQPHVDTEGGSHTHKVYLGIPENIVRLQSNLRKVFSATKPAHIKTGEVSSVIDEDIPILAQGKKDVFSPILVGNDATIITGNLIDNTLPYYNQNASSGLVGLSVGSLHQDDMRKAREGVYEDEFYGYAIGNEIRVWRTNVQVADSLVIPYEDGSTKYQKLRVVSKTSGNTPNDGVYDSIVDSGGNSYTYKTIRDLRRGTGAEDHRIQTVESLEVINSVLYPTPDGFGLYGDIGRTELLNDGEPVLFQTEVYFCTKLSSDYDSSLLPNVNLAGNRIRFSYTSIKVDAQIKSQGLILLRNTSSPWVKRDTVEYETVEFTYEAQDPNLWVTPYNWAINLPSYIVKSMLKLNKGLPVSISDLTLKINGLDINYSDHMLSLEHTDTYIPFNTNQQTYDSQALLRIYDFKFNILGAALYNTPLIQIGDQVKITFPKSKSEVRRFRELNNLGMTLNATRPTRKVSLSGRGLGQNRVVSTTSPISYVLNDPTQVSPYTQEQKRATYSVGVSNLLNTQNHHINSNYTLNNFSLNQTTSPDQVFKPSIKTFTTSNPVVSFYELGFRPSFITSVIDSEGSSYTYSLNQDHLLVSNLLSEKTLTVSGISSNPFMPDLDWYKGEKLAEGQAFYRHTKTSDLGSFTEPPPEKYMQNPLGLSEVKPTTIKRTRDNVVVEDEVYVKHGDNHILSLQDQVLIEDSELVRQDQIRSVYSMNEISSSGVEGELAFYEDEVSRYEVDGREGFTNEFNSHCPQDEVLYPDPTLYLLGPRSQVETGVTVNTIPTYLFFGYMMLLDFDANNDIVYYLSIYRIDSQGVKQYQTLTPITDPNLEDTFQESGASPESNGSPLAYRFLGDNGFGSLEYNQMDSTAYANISFNHIPNETYYVEVFFEQSPAGGASFLGFFSKGASTNVALSDSWLNLNQNALQNEVEFLGQGGSNTSETYQVTFTTNPGEIDTISNIADPNASANRETETVGATHILTTTTYYADDYYPIIPLEYNFSDDFNFVLEDLFKGDLKENVGVISDDVIATLNLI